MPNNKIKIDRNLEDKIYIAGNAVFAVFLAGSYLFVLIACLIKGNEFKRVIMFMLFVLILYIFPASLFFEGWKKFHMSKYEIMERRELCTQPVNAVLAEFEKKTVSAYGDGYATSYFAIYEYEWLGRKYRTKSNRAFAGVTGEGAQCTILINPDVPTEIYELNDEKAQIIQRKIIGGGMVVLGILSAVPIVLILKTAFER